MAALYPEVEPYASGRLAVGDGQRIYWEACGNPAGRPALVLHGGPGSGCAPGMRRLFDPGAYRVILFDQRGSGRSLPHASDPAVDLGVNTTHHLLEDIERLRIHLGIERWVIFGGSWGSTLALAYAERRPERTAALVLAYVGLSRPADTHWLYHGVGRYFPEAWARFRAGAGVGDADANLVEAYARLLASPDPDVRARAASDWCDWEMAVISLDPKLPRPTRYADPAFRYVFARVVTHYFRHAVWLGEDELLTNAHRLVGIPGVMVHGRLDLGSPLAGAWALQQVWPGSRLVVVENAGHESTTPGMNEGVVAALDRFARG
ncbi:MAG TPA: prolyl aminopeptidase [Caulobacteraceae bacterium]|nr:prolyl aminopeptidase [Caulobacteraceae bacterium]